ncbi:hypothetical protein EVAR_44302_1 [Eumeta japonica]|uniref:Uncharacterized protein n=1 Tax=Eumeta variegata TaxID=151549 RepID=A0A4C1WPT6_EUMVA|nr:hypothetical protein EVAR_44302_1 [Eumeta japonica]
MQMLRLEGTQPAASDNESVTSIEYHKPNNSTIDLKADVHRKNSSESSIEDSVMSTKPTEPVATTKSDLCVAQNSEVPGPSKPRSSNTRRSRCGHKREYRSAKARRLRGNTIEELSIEECPRSSKTEDSVTVNIDHEGPFAKVSRRYYECPHRRGWNNKDFFKEWLYMDCYEAAREPYQSEVCTSIKL